MEPNILAFWEKYELLSSSENYSAEKIKGKICRYCEKNENETTFKQITHLIPELIGENDIHTFDECDSCNNLFSGYESNFAVFIRPYLILGGIKGKTKIPAFHSRTEKGNEETRTIFKHREGNRKELHLQDLDDYTIDEETKTFSITFRKSSFTPLKVYKALLKIGLSLLPVKYDEFNRHSFEWITNRKEDLNFIPSAFITTLKGKKFTKAYAELYRAKKLVIENEMFPEHILILHFANQVFQIFLPFSDELKKEDAPNRNLSLLLFPSYAYDEIIGEQINGFRSYDLGVSTPITENHKISFSYEQADIQIPHK
ncbi:MAG: hypothetical protein Q8M29_04865 [Bacteroidota bacterium]|nr:hypothetical protein [Bacteroidota bacterium]